MISKTAYLSFLQCPKRFWFEKWEPERAEAPDAAAQRRMQEGIRTGRLARSWFPGGWLIPYQTNTEETARLTAEAMAEGETALFEAVFLAGDLLAKTDVIRREDEGWQLIEVKSSTSVKKEHLPDIAFQLHVLQAAGVDPAKDMVMHLNRDCRAPNLDDLFIVEDVSGELEDLLLEIGSDVEEMRHVAELPQAPLIDIGRHCFRPDKCPFYNICWQGIEGLTLFTIPRLNEAKEQELRDMGVLYLDEIPMDFPLTPKQREYVDFHVQEKIEIDKLAIRQALDGLQYPLYFFDFETIGYAVPLFDGTAPHQQVPFQYSCHVLQEDGTLTHHHYLHTQTGDPRPALLESLLADIGPAGHIVVYNAMFERGILKELADSFPQASNRLHELIDRLWDQLIIFRKHYQHYAFRGSNSLKAVLPIVVPQLSYDSLAIADGLLAQVVWEEMIELPPGPEKEQLVVDLLAYCQLDTLAMVEIHKALAGLN